MIAALRWPVTEVARHSLVAVAATIVGLLAFVPGLPAAVSAVLLAGFVAVGPGSALLAWFTRSRPAPVSRLILVPVVGLAATVLVATVAVGAGWWAPNGLFGFLALCTVWSVLPNLGSVVRDVAP